MQEGLSMGLCIMFGFVSSPLGLLDLFEVLLFAQTPTILQIWRMMVDC
jgi:hypothetical protein